MRYARYAHAALAAWAALGCDSTSSSPSSLIVEPRVLAIRAEPPVVAPDGTVALSALVVDAAGEPVLSRVSFRACSPWQTVAEPSGDCGPESSLALTASAEATGAVLDITEMLAAFPPPPWFEPESPAGEEAGMDEQPDSCAADYRYLDVAVIFTANAMPAAQGSEPKELVAIKRVRVSEPGTRRNNPEIAEVTLNGESGITRFRPGAAYELGVTLQPDSLDQSCLDDGQPALEPVRIYVFSDAGDLNERGFDIQYTAGGEELAGSVTWTAPAAGEADTARLWLVAIDSDGGASWQTLTLTAGAE